MNSQGTFALTQVTEQQTKLPNIFTQKHTTLPLKKGGITTLASSSLQTARQQGPIIPRVKLPQTQRSFSVKNKREISERLLKTKREEDIGEIANLVKQIESEVNLQVDSMYRALSPKTLENKIKQIEASQQSKEILGTLTRYILKAKNIYNDLVYEKKLKMKQQKFLQEQIANLKVASLDSEFLMKRVKNLDDKHDEIIQMNENEKFQTEILIYMRTKKKLESMELQKPITELRKQLQIKSRQISEISQQTYRKIVELKSHEMECQQVINETHNIRDKRESDINQDLQVYKQRCILMKIFHKEQEKDFESQCQRLDLLRSVEEDTKRKSIQEEEMLDKELQKNEEYIQRQERLFQQIKQVTSVNSIQDMLPHLKYLEHTKLSLQEAAENTKQLIIEKQKLLQDLLIQKQEVLFLTNDKKEGEAQDSLDNKLFQKDRHLLDAEKKLNYFNKLIATSNAVIHKMGCQLADQEIECRPDNLSEYLSELGMKLETMIQAIDKKKIAPLDQSLLDKPPAFLNINERQYPVQEEEQYESKEQLAQINPQKDEESKVFQETKNKRKKQINIS